MSPAQVQHVVSKAQEEHAGDGEESSEQLGELLVRESHNSILPRQVRAVGSRDHHYGDNEEHTASYHSSCLRNLLSRALVQVNSRKPSLEIEVKVIKCKTRRITNSKEILNCSSTLMNMSLNLGIIE